jgi:hypothetical protein
MPAFLLAAILMQAGPCRGDAARLITEAVSLGEAFDLPGAAAAYATAERAAASLRHVTQRRISVRLRHCCP